MHPPPRDDDRMRETDPKFETLNVAKGRLVDSESRTKLTNDIDIDRIESYHQRSITHFSSVSQLNDLQKADRAPQNHRVESPPEPPEPPRQITQKRHQSCPDPSPATSEENPSRPPSLPLREPTSPFTCIYSWSLLLMASYLTSSCSSRF